MTQTNSTKATVPSAVEAGVAAAAQLTVPPLAAEPDTTPPRYLPAQVVVTLLQHVDCSTRLTVCARVCRTWAAAAVAASSSIDLCLAHNPVAKRHERAEGFGRWLLQHHGEVRRMCVQGKDMSRPQLLLPADALLHLQQLILADCKVSLLTTSAGDSYSPGCSNKAGLDQHSDSGASMCWRSSLPASLTALQLQRCVLDWRQGALPVPVALSSLRQLHLQHLLPGDRLSKQQRDAMQHSVPAAFCQLTQLTQLVLKRLHQYEPVLLTAMAAGLGCMQQLLELQVDMLQLTAGTLADLPTTLTLLELSGAKQLMVSTAEVPALSCLTDLQMLEVEGVRRFEPRVLHHMPKLRGLRLRSSSSRFLPDGTTGTQDLLAALQGLSGLETLDIRNVLQHLLHEQLLQAYSSLTASSRLRYLDLSACRFPPDCDQLLLHGGVSLPQLQQLVLYRCEDPSGSVLQLQDLHSLVQCCPALQDLSFWLADSSSRSSSSSGAGSIGNSEDSFTGAGQQMHALLGLPALTRLVVAGPGLTPAAAAAVAQLQQLSSLAMYRCRNLTAEALAGLTQLTQLTSLAVDVRSCTFLQALGDEYVFLQGPAGHIGEGGPQLVQEDPQQQVTDKLPVWMQLEKMHLSIASEGL